jgi:hypothetical protein
MKRLKFWMLLLALLLLMVTPVLADGPEGDVVIFGKSYTLESDQEIQGDLVVYGGDVTVETAGQVRGNVTVFGGNLTLAGEVDGDVTVWGGNVKIDGTAVVRGQLMTVGGEIDRSPDADIRGDEIEGMPVPGIPQRSDVPELPSPPTASRQSSSFGQKIAGFFRGLFGILLSMVLGILVVAFIPRHTETVAETMAKDPARSALTGLAALLLGSLALGVLFLIGSLLIATLCLAPVGLALYLPALVAAIALLFGWIAAGLLLGTKVLRAIRNKEPTPVAAVAIGVLLLSMLSAIPCVGWALALGIAVWSLGAVINSRFGTRPWDNGPDAEIVDAEIAPDYDPRLDQV